MKNALDKILNKGGSALLKKCMMLLWHWKGFTNVRYHVTVTKLDYHDQ